MDRTKKVLQITAIRPQGSMKPRPRIVSYNDDIIPISSVVVEPIKRTIESFSRDRQHSQIRRIMAVDNSGVPWKEPQTWPDEKLRRVFDKYPDLVEKIEAGHGVTVDDFRKFGFTWTMLDEQDFRIEARRRRDFADIEAKEAIAIRQKEEVLEREREELTEIELMEWRKERVKDNRRKVLTDVGSSVSSKVGRPRKEKKKLSLLEEKVEELKATRRRIKIRKREDDDELF